MESWQKQHIQLNLVQLIKDTNCNAHLTSILKQKGILGTVDVQSLELIHLTPFEKSKLLYELVLGRVGAYDVLLDALKETNQSGAFYVLQQHNPIFHDSNRVTYDKNHVLGKGIGTKVYKGSFGGREVAVKVLNADFVDLDVSKREVDFLKKLDNHENIVRYFTVEVSDNYVCIALELCHISLEDEMKMHLVNMDPISVVKQCTSGLAHLHQHNVIHRDLKPANILLTLEHQVKISDFGLSKQIPMGADSVSITGVAGTGDWMAPEILTTLQNGFDDTIKMTTSSDIFSLGCVFYFVSTNGLHPFGDILQRQFYIVQNNPQLTNHDAVSSSLMRIILDMISFDPESRPSADEILSSECFQVQFQSLSSQQLKQMTLREYYAGANSIENGSEKINISAPNSPKITLPERNSRLQQPALAPKRLDAKLGLLLLGAIKKGQPLFVLKDLLEEGADYRVKDEVGRGILHNAAGTGNVEMLQYLETFDVNINERDDDGNTPLLGAAGNLEMLYCLISKGSKINVVNRWHMNLAHCAAAGMHRNEDFHQLVSLLVESYQLYDLFHMKDADGYTPLLKRFLYKDAVEVSTIQLIASIPGIDMNTTNIEGENMLHLAVERNYDVSIVAALVTSGVNYKLKSPTSGKTLLTTAMVKRNLKYINYLLTLDFDVPYYIQLDLRRMGNEDTKILLKQRFPAEHSEQSSECCIIV